MSNAQEQEITAGSTSAKASTYTLVKFDEDADFMYQGQRVVRKGVRIRVPQGLSRQELSATLESAAWAVYDKSPSNAVMVFAYRQGDPVDGAYTAGRCILAPNGRWEDARLYSGRSTLRATVDTTDLYFNPVQSAVVGSQVELHAQDDTIPLSRGPSSWRDPDIVAELPSGTLVKVLEVKRFPMGETELIRYRVQVHYRGKSLTGWVHKSAVK